MAAWNGPQPAPRALWQAVHSNFPVTRNLGIYNRRNVAGTHTPSHHAEGRALDIGLNATIRDEKLLGDQLYVLLIASANDLGLDEIIWNRQIWSSRRPHLHPYTGHSPHTDHIHVGFTRAASQRALLPSSVWMRIAALRTGLEELGSTLVGGKARGNA